MIIRQPDLTDIRRQLHRIPEIAFQENETRELLLSYLQNLSGITLHRFSSSTGLLVEYSHGEGSYLLFRADMDALPIPEDTHCSFTSKHPGLMHACGHDIHMTVLLGLIYRVLENNLQKNLLFLFQPAEEGMGGAESVLKEGLLQSYDISSAFALHISGELPVGTISSKPGIFFAIPQEFDVLFTGKAAHAAFPEKGLNALAGGLEFYDRVTRYMEQVRNSEQAIFNIGVLQAGTIRNVIPDKCLLQGTHRTLTKDLRDRLNVALENMAQEVGNEMNLQASLQLLCTYDPVVNDAKLVEELKTVCGQLGIDYRNSHTYMTGEDFGFFTTIYPGLLFWLGGGESPDGLHSGKFLPSEDSIGIGVDIFYQLIETAW